MDAELRDSLDAILSQGADTLKAVRELEQQGREHEVKITQLQTHVFGSKGPPPLTPSGQHAVTPPTLAKRTTNAEGSIADLTGVVLRVEGVVDQIRKSKGIAMPEASRFRQVATFLRSRDGWHTLLIVAAAVYAATHGITPAYPEPRLPLSGVPR